jgi:hypothetical protein
MQKGLVLALAGVALAGAPAAAQDRWEEFRCKEGGFRVMLPAKPNYMKKAVNNGPFALDVHNYAAMGDAMAYVVSYLDCPEEAVEVLGPDNLLKGFRDGFARGARGKLQGEKKITWNGISGVELKLDSGTGVRAVCRVGMVGNRLYQLLATAPGDKIESPEVAKYFKSFKVSGAGEIVNAKGIHVSIKPAAKPGVKAVPSAVEAGRPGDALGTSKGAGASKTADQPAGGGWKEQRLRGGFAVNAPGAMTYDKVRVTVDAGLVTLHQNALEIKGETYRAGYVDFPETAVQCGTQSVLDAERNRLVASLGGRLMNDQPLDLNGHAGSQCRIDLPNSRSAMVRLFLAGNRLYEVMTITPTEGSYSESSLRFLDSFRLMK